LLAELVQISWEATPGADTGVLTYLIKEDYKEQRRYLDAILEALETSKNGDIISQEIGLNINDVIVGFSAWESRVGAGAQTYTKVQTIQNGSSIDIPQKQKMLINQYCALLGYLLRQEAVIWYFQDKDASNLEETNGIEAKFHAKLNEGEFQEVYNQMHSEFNTWNLAPGYLQDGFNVLNYEDKIANQTFLTGMKNVFMHLNQMGLGQGLKNEKTFRSVGHYLANNWTNFPNGEQYQEYVQDRKLWDWAKEMRKWRIDVVNAEFEPNVIKYFLQK